MKIQYFFCALTCCVLGYAGAAEQDAVRQDVYSGKLKPLSEILQSVQKTHAGRVLDVELERQADGQRWYEIKLLRPIGERVEMYVDAVTGAEVRRSKTLPATQISMAAAVRAALANTPGTVLKVELEKASSPQPVYEVRILRADGHKLNVRVDANSARLLDAPTQERQATADLLPLPVLLELLEPRYAGRIMEAELKRERSGAVYYEVEIQLDNGRELEVNIDGTTGRVIREDGLR